MNQMLYREILIQLSMLVIYKGNFWEKTTTKKNPKKQTTKQNPQMSISFLLNYKYALTKYRILKYCARALNIDVLAHFIYFHLQELPLTID